jgi:hypothetical protein
MKDSEIVVKMEPGLHIIRGRYEGDNNYRAELRKIDDDCSEFVFGTVANVDDYYVCVLRCKLYTCHKEKIAFIMDLRGFANNLWEPLEVYRLNSIENYWKRSELNMELFDSSLKRMLVGWDIHKYDDEGMHVFQITRDIFNNVLFYPHELCELLPVDVVDKINDINKPKRIDTGDEKWHYNEDVIKKLWERCDETHSDHGTIGVWFGLGIEESKNVFR